MNETNNATLRDHLPNERTFLAWIRTCIGIMAFGFVVEKFALFLKQITVLLQTQHVPIFLTSPILQGYSSFFGIILEAFGTLMCLLSYINYKRVSKEIEENRYE